jgi:LacI family transcriptional regulator
LQQVVQQGLSVPQDLAIVGYDDIDFAGAAAVPLTSVRQPRELLGRTGAGLLIEEDAALADGVEHEHRQIQFTPELIIRESSHGSPRLARSGTARA